jgi:hypothetical protein
MGSTGVGVDRAGTKPVGASALTLAASPAALTIFALVSFRVVGIKNVRQGSAEPSTSSNFGYHCGEGVGGVWLFPAVIAWQHHQKKIATKAATRQKPITSGTLLTRRTL